MTTKTALDDYLKHLELEGNKKASRDRTRWAVRRFFPEPVPLWGLTERRLQARYEAVRRGTDPGTKPLAVDSHRNALAEVKTFLDWCVVRKWLSASPAAKVAGVGKRRRRKRQLNVKDARKWYAVAEREALAGHPGSVAALLALLTGMRASEIVTLRVRHLDEIDEPADTLHVEDAKTDAGVRTLFVHPVLREPLRALCEGKKPDHFVFHAGKDRAAQHWRDWVRKQSKRICTTAKVPYVTAHGLRGMLATLGLRAGAEADAVARMLGHTKTSMTRDHYAAEGAVEDAARQRGLKVLSGGKE